MDIGTLLNLAVTLVGALVVGGVLVGAVLMNKHAAGVASRGGGPLASGAAALSAAMTQRLGYAAQGDPAAQAADLAAHRMHMVRSVSGRSLHWMSETQASAGATRVSMSWQIPLGTPARVPLHVVSSRRGGVAEWGKDAMLSRSRSFQPRYSVALTPRDPATAAKLVAYTEPGYEAAAHAVLEDPELSRWLVGLAFVDLRVEPGVVRFDDPFQEALLAPLGGPLAAMRMLTPEGIEVVVGFHTALGAGLCRLAERVS